MTAEKRPSSDMMKPKPKPQKKKKKKDPNEPTKPVSAYALFFRDTQAAIKGQNPNATFGDVSKIVASMWDGLGEEQKQVRMSFCCTLGKQKACLCHTDLNLPVKISRLVWVGDYNPMVNDGKNNVFQALFLSWPRRIRIRWVI